MSNDPGYFQGFSENLTINYKSYENIVPIVTGIDKRVAISASLESNIPPIMDFGSFQMQTNIQKFVATPQQITVLDSIAQDISVYNTEAVAQGETWTGSLDASAANANAIASNTGEVTVSSISTYLAESRLGVVRLSQNPVIIQQGYLTKPIIGSDNILEEGLYINVVPTINRIDENLLARYKYLVVDTKTGFLGFSPAGIFFSKPTYETLIPRTIAWTVQHKAVKANMRVEFSVSALTDFTQINEPNKPDLEIPQTMYDDMFWENYLTGETGVMIDVSDADPFAQWLGALWGRYSTSIIIILVVVAIVGFIFLRSKFGGSGGSRTTKFNINIGNRGNRNDKE
jgi:hypothetical protein